MKGSHSYQSVLYQFHVPFSVESPDDDLDLIKRIWCLFRRVILHRFDLDDGLMVIFSRRHYHNVALVAILIGQIAVFFFAIWN